MIRYIDIKDQVCEGYPEFAWWDTVIDRFLIFNDSQTWETWEDFEEDFKATGYEDDLTGRVYEFERLKGLYPKDRK